MTENHNPADGYFSLRVFGIPVIARYEERESSLYTARRDIRKGGDVSVSFCLTRKPPKHEVSGLGCVLRDDWYDKYSEEGYPFGKSDRCSVEENGFNLVISVDGSRRLESVPERGRRPFYSVELSEPAESESRVVKNCSKQLIKTIVSNFGVLDGLYQAYEVKDSLQLAEVLKVIFVHPRIFLNKPIPNEVGVTLVRAKGSKTGEVRLSETPDGLLLSFEDLRLDGQTRTLYCFIN